MADNRNVSIGESNKLEGSKNCYMWSLKMQAILRRENWWEIIQNELIPEAFPTNIGGRSIMQVQLALMKVAAISALTLSMSDDLIGTVVVYVDPALESAALKVVYQSEDQS